MRHIFKTYMLSDYLSQNNLSMQEFCNKCDITIKDFENLMRNDKVCVRVLGRVAYTLNTHVMDMFSVEP